MKFATLEELQFLLDAGFQLDTAEDNIWSTKLSSKPGGMQILIQRRDPRWMSANEKPWAAKLRPGSWWVDATTPQSALQNIEEILADYYSDDPEVREYWRNNMLARRARD